MKNKWLKTGIVSAFILFALYMYVVLNDKPVNQPETNLMIGSGSRGGNYYKTGKYIANAYNKAFHNYRFSSVATNGSNKNIQLLRDNSIDLAIIQRNVLIDGIYNNDKGIKNLTVLMPLFQEKLQMYVSTGKATDLRKIDSLFKSKKIRIGITNKKGYSYDIFNRTLTFLDINLPETEWVEKNYDTLIDYLKHQKLDILVSFSTDIPVLERNKNIHKLFLSKSDAGLLESRLHKIHATPIDTSKQQYSLGSWSFLVGKKSAVQYLKPKEKLIGALLNDTTSAYQNVKTRIQSSFKSFRRNAHHEKALLQLLPLSDDLQKRMEISSGYSQFYLYFFVAILLFGLLYLIFKKRLLFFWRRYKHFQYGLLLIIFIYFISIELLVHFEKSFYLQGGGKSQILNMTRPDLHLWLLITTLTGNTGGIYPLTGYGKMMILLNSVNSWIGTIFIAFSEFMIYKMNTKRKQGLMKTKFKDHLIIFGWNSTAEKFVSEIINEAKTYLDQKVDIVCVVPDIAEVRNKHERIRILQDKKIIDIIQGSALHARTLDMCNTIEARTVILLSEDSSKISDEHTVMRAHAISRYAKKKTRQLQEQKEKNAKKITHKVKQVFTPHKEDVEKNDIIYMIAEINNNDFKESLIDAGVNEIVIAGNYRKAIMKQSLFNHGISKVIDEIMQYNEFNEFYKIDLAKPENKHLVGHTFDELHIALRKHGILLIGIHIIFKEKGRIIIDQEIIKKKLEEFEASINRDVLVNPTESHEVTRKVDNNDHLIVLAVSNSQLKESIKKITF